MSQRVSGYVRKDDELYETPGWVAEALAPHLPRQPKVILEPAAGSGRMVQALAGALGPRVRILSGNGDFLAPSTYAGAVYEGVDAIITNPPYGAGGRLAVKFIERALEMTHNPEYGGGMVAMLLRVDFDSARGRANIFGDCRAWARKLVLRRRIMWFASETGCGPSENHAWYIWDWRHMGPPTIAYGP